MMSELKATVYTGLSLGAGVGGGVAGTKLFQETWVSLGLGLHNTGENVPTLISDRRSPARVAQEPPGGQQL